MSSNRQTMVFHRVKSVRPLPGFKLLVQFLDGERRQYDVLPLLQRWQIFEPLVSVDGLFEQVHVDSGGYGVVWNDELDLSCNELYDNGVEM